MRYVAICLIIIFYIFFFLRGFLLSRKLGRSVKTNDALLNISIFSAGFTTVLFLIQTIVPGIHDHLLVVWEEDVLMVIGTILIAIGVVFSSVASLNMGGSWRVGVSSDERTGLVTTGLYRFSRNPYFLSYDMVLMGILLASLSLPVMVLSVATMALFHLLVLREERYLERTHGHRYREYKKTVRRYI